MPALDDAIKLAGGLTSLAEKVGVKPQVVSNWRRRGIPATRCAEVEIVTGGRVTRAHLRPDVFGPLSRSKKRAA